eukprot:TRINITY_DN7170_c0_g1_i1.p1 TRINITY_DN7170_c0_g1~~TRINITY_DN7170_c0_g1_i1.p1  ORF type:complete len:255 (-),score=43.18 TRINITY_DN7170_c0_g1_i1:61-825(-)
MGSLCGKDKKNTSLVKDRPKNYGKETVRTATPTHQKESSYKPPAYNAPEAAKPPIRTKVEYQPSPAHKQKTFTTTVQYQPEPERKFEKTQQKPKPVVTKEPYQKKPEPKQQTFEKPKFEQKAQNNIKPSKPSSNSGSYRCAVCRRDITDGGVVHAGAMDLHQSCFNCVSCRQNLFKKKFIELSGKIYCEKCGTDEQLSEQPACAGCGKPLIGDCTQALGKPFHVSCFKCAKCKTSLTGKGYVPVNGKPFCEKCG